MHWIETPEKGTATVMREKRLGEATDQFRANSGLEAQEYSCSVLGLTFSRFATSLRRPRPHGYRLCSEWVSLWT